MNFSQTKSCDNLSQRTQARNAITFQTGNMRPRVLVVEDDPDLRRTLVRHLEREGCQVVDGRDGVEAVEKLDGGYAAQLIITDLEMPRAGGRQVLAAGLARKIPVGILPGHANPATAGEMMRGGAANFLSKPVSPPSLRAVLDDTFGPRGVPVGPAGPIPSIGQGAPPPRKVEPSRTMAAPPATTCI